MHSLSCSTAAEVHSGVVWCLQQKNGVLVTGSHDKTVSAYIHVHICIMVMALCQVVAALLYLRY